MYDHASGPGGAAYMMPSFLVTDVRGTVTTATAAGAAVEHVPAPKSSPTCATWHGALARPFNGTPCVLLRS
ncbi:hypothetical protein SMD11_6163 [Streptomyces albireticuli]|uniref:Uncharacterized protein n=1 Tax=Streptomyces albireticuli TaxID=1940 RepID=A0A1Z2LBP9_9ACTN|nr:hypothetical protein SMD11_6163 [Streptomyces albireticuli]